MPFSAIYNLEKPIVLLGMMGVGKTTFGKKAASILKIPFHDVDQEIEADIGHSVSWIFENAGEKEFRKIEEQKIRDLVGNNKQFILALGGGAFINDNTRGFIKEKAVSVWLKSSVETIFKRVSVRKDRPLLEGVEDKLGKIREITETREVYYKQADITVETDYGSQKEVANRIIDAVNNFALTSK